MKGWKKVARKVYQNAQLENKSKDKLGGKEHRGSPESSPEYYRIGDENLEAVLPRLTPGKPIPGSSLPVVPVSLPMSEKKLIRIRKACGYMGVK